MFLYLYTQRQPFKLNLFRILSALIFKRRQPNPLFQRLAGKPTRLGH